MDNKPVIFFFSLLLLSAVIVVLYQSKANPFAQAKAPAAVSNAQNPVVNPHQADPAIELFSSNCARCHGGFGEGKGTNPSLQKNGLGVDQIIHIITNGRGSMPSFTRFSPAELQKLAELVQRF